MQEGKLVNDNKKLNKRPTGLPVPLKKLELSKSQGKMSCKLPLKRNQVVIRWKYRGRQGALEFTRERYE
ncbi:hypothetical protein E2C01_034902 [Portunus trituberculatus]|uniref:Uncharacterized protein n=1 Tax=Portunus trituberculatus TaxID=210409 RepID=A0A5B7FA12_PORTR|nr:hypothetical protein [Portunus trituberculatus]